MLAGIAQWQLHLEGCHSLKDKRSVIKPLLSHLRQRCNVSAAETGRQDQWQESEIACAAVGSDRRIVEETLRMADRLVEAADGVRITDSVTVYR
jgi:uncharacterized protein YlxP (DUF503 family)